MCLLDDRITRRRFLGLGASGAALSALAEFVDGTKTGADPIGPLPRRRLGRTGLEVSVIVGASDWNPAVIPTAVASGVNYWHKAEEWARTGTPEALKRLPRESYFLECVVDRVGGHLRGHLDEEAHVAFVKECARASGAGYYDVLKFHFGYHSVREAKSERAMVRAFERLRKEGLVHHLAISQHDYNTKAVGGDKAVDILGYLIERSPYEAGQIFYTLGDGKEKEDLLALARAKEFGMIAMKTMAGVGRASADPRFRGQKPGAALVKWLVANPNLSASAIAIANFAQLQEDLSAARSAPTAADVRALKLLAGRNRGLTCLLCAGCVDRCPQGIAVSDIFRCERYARDYHQPERARAEYAALTRGGTRCAGCGACLADCPAGLDVPARLREVDALLRA